MPLLFLPLFLLAGYRLEKTATKLGGKYLGHLSDNDLKNFEYYY